MSLRILSKEAVTLVSKGGGGARNPLAVEIVENIEAIRKAGGVFISEEDLSPYVKNAERGPNSLLYSLRTSANIFMGYRRAEHEQQRGFWCFPKDAPERN